MGKLIVFLAGHNVMVGVTDYQINCKYIKEYQILPRLSYIWNI